MRVEPGGAELLRVARAELMGLLEHLPQAHHYSARMIANAMAIAAREMSAPPARAYDHAELAREIRSGRHDDSAATHERLVAITRARLATSNPRVLEAPK